MPLQGPSTITRDRSNWIKGHVFVLLNIPIVGMPIYAHPHTVSLGFVLGDADDCATTPPGEQRQTTLQCYSTGEEILQNCPFPWGVWAAI